MQKAAHVSRTIYLRDLSFPGLGMSPEAASVRN